LELKEGRKDEAEFNFDPVSGCPDFVFVFVTMQWPTGMC